MIASASTGGLGLCPDYCPCGERVFLYIVVCRVYAFEMYEHKSFLDKMFSEDVPCIVSQSRDGV